LYDFSLEKGMTFKHQHYHFLLEIINSDTIEINGILKKRLQISRAPSSFYDSVIDTWIEDVGSLLGILYPCRLLNGWFTELLCFFQNDELIYKSPDYSECFYEGYLTVLPVEKNGLIVSPNPANDRIVISASDQTISSIEIFDIIGKKVYCQVYHEVVDISSFSEGMYILKIHNTNGQVSNFKIIKK
jgi:hypothetical protein